MLVPGQRLGPYEITSSLGAGGMGEVYKARDTRIDRTVAIKVLPEHLSKDPARRERFEREARAVSSLSHPHICTLYEFDTQDGVDFIVMEYIEGETLAERLKRGPIELGRAIEYGVQIAGALDKAHRQGIVHRDLKPGNIMLTRSGVKLLDFGLARLRQTFGEASPDESAPTEAKPLTEEGAILGTLQYMSPEQLEAKEADARSDIFAFGAVLYEMLTGNKAFEGSSQASLITAIMSTDPPPVSELQSMSPRPLDRLVKKSLAKDPEDRWHSAHDLADELKWVAEGSDRQASSKTTQPRRLSLILAAALLGAVVTGLIAWIARGSRPNNPPALVTHWVMTLPPDESGENALAGVALSPDGTHLAIATRRQLYLRAMDSPELNAVPESEGAHAPFFSPDGEWVAFFTESELKKVRVRGGNPQSLTRVSFRNTKATWSPNGQIIFTGAQGLLLISDSGGSAEKLTLAEDDELWHDFPEFLPSGDTVLFAVMQLQGRWDDATIVVESLATGDRKELLEGGSNPFYSPSGHLVYLQGTTLLAAPFDITTLEVTGDPFPVVEGVLVGGSGNGYFDLSRQGTLVYISGTPSTTRMVWVDRQGAATPAGEYRDQFDYPRISPDGTHIAVSTHPASAAHDIWIFDLDRGSRTRSTTTGHNNAPIWTPDGQRIDWVSIRGGTEMLYEKPADAAGEGTTLSSRSAREFPNSWSPDGKVLIYTVVSEGETPTGRDIWMLPTEGEPSPLIATPAEEFTASFSPDGRWIAYVSDRSGQQEVYVQSYPNAGDLHSISTGGGTSPIWSPKGGELFYQSLTGDQMFVVAVTTQPEFSASRPEVLFEGQYEIDNGRRAASYDVAPDGERFLMVREEEDLTAADVHVVVNWSETLTGK